MRLADVKFYRSIALWSAEIYLDKNAEVIFVWRSNVGKSSIMNALFEKKDLVKTSSRPGKTKTANLFVVENKYYFTDLPWYGFARLGKNLRDELDGLISWYIEERKSKLKKVVILIDAKIWAQETDLEMYKYLLEMELPVTIVLSKIDRLNKSDIYKSETHAKNEFFGQEIISVSSTKKIWLKELSKSIQTSLLS